MYGRPLIALRTQQMGEMGVSLRSDSFNGARRSALRRGTSQVVEDLAQQLGITLVHTGLAAVHQYVHMVGAALLACQGKQVRYKVAALNEIHHD